MSIWTRLHRLVDRIGAAFCHHPEGTMCGHNGYAHDLRLSGYIGGFQAGKANVEAKWLGNLTGDGPYAGYPPPRAALGPSEGERTDG